MQNSWENICIRVSFWNFIKMKLRQRCSCDFLRNFWEHLFYRIYLVAPYANNKILSCLSSTQRLVIDFHNIILWKIRKYPQWTISQPSYLQLLCLYWCLWKGIEDGVNKFVFHVLHCLSTISQNRKNNADSIGSLKVD